MRRLVPLLMALAAVLPARAQRPLLDLSAGDLHFRLDPVRGVQLTARGAAVIHESHIYLVTPNWTASLLNSEQLKPEVASFEENGAKVGTATYETKDAWARLRYEVRPDNTFVMKAAYCAQGQPAEVECAAMLNGNLLQGVAYAADTVDGPRTGIVPPTALYTDQIKARLTPSLRSIIFDTAAGPMAVHVAGNTPASSSMTLFDARAMLTDWAARRPAFWFGIGSPSKAIAPGENTVTVTYAFGPAPKREETPVTLSTRVKPLRAAAAPFVADLPVIPKPKEATYAGRPMRIGAATRIVIPRAAVPEEAQAARELQADLLQRFGVKVAIARGKARPAGDIEIRRLAAGAPDAESAGTPPHAEGYALRVSDKGARLIGRDARGAYFAAQTLKQLIRVDEQGAYVKPASIRDWPTLAFRGVHWFGGPKSYPFHRQMIDRIVAPLKMNAMVYECEFTEWNSQPGIRDERTTPKSEVKKSIRHARERFLDVIPMMPSLGHMDWLFLNKQNLDIAADPEHPYAYDPDNPRSYDVMFALFQEAIDLFAPKTFLIGHDEVELVGTFPPKGSKKTTTELYVQDVNKIYDWLKAKGISTMMWGDMLLHSTEGSGGAAFAPTVEEARKRRAGIPKDITIADWHYNYSAEPEYPSIDVLQKAGFPVIAASWYGWANVHDFAKVAADLRAKGLLQTTWAGYMMSTDLMDTQEFGQFVAYLVAAEQAWNGGANDPKGLGYGPEDAFLTLWNAAPAERRARPGFGVEYKGNSVGFGGVPNASPLMLAGALNPEGKWPHAATLPVGRPAGTLRFVWGTTQSVDIKTRVATLTVTYADGTTAVVPVNYGKEIWAFTDLRARPGTTVIHRGASADGQPVNVRRWDWKNPRPGLSITSVTLTSDRTEAAPVLLSLTGIDR